MSRAKSILVQAEVGPQINPPYIFIGSQLIWRAIPENHAIRNDVRTVSNSQRFTDIVVSYEHANATRLEMKNDLLNISDGDRIDAGKRLVEEDETR